MAADHVSIDFTHINPNPPPPGMAIPWARGTDPRLSSYFTDADVPRLMFACSDGARNINFYVDNGLVLQFGAASLPPTESIGVYVANKTHKPLNFMEIRFDVIIAEPQASRIRYKQVRFGPISLLLPFFFPWIVPQPRSFIGAVTAEATDDDVDLGILKRDREATLEPDPKRIGANCNVNYDPDWFNLTRSPANQERLRLKAPPGMYVNTGPLLPGLPPDPSHIDPYPWKPFSFLLSPPHPLNLPPAFDPPANFRPEPFILRCDTFAPGVKSATGNATAQISLKQGSGAKLFQQGKDTDIFESGAYGNQAYQHDLSKVGFAGASMHITDASTMPFNTGPMCVRIKSLEVQFE